MTTENKKRFTVITNQDFEHKESEKQRNYQTNPMQEKLIKFTATKKFSVEDLLKW